MAARNYSSVARLATLTAGINNSTTSCAVDQTTGFPTIPFTLVIDPGRPAEEVVTVTSVVGLNLTLIRGEDGTAAQPHDAAAQVRHMATARDFREAAEHISATSNVHGTTGTLVTTSDAQSLDNKTFTAQVTDHVPVRLVAASGQSAHMLDVVTSGGTVIASIGVDGRITTVGVDGSSTSTFTSNSAVVVPLVVKAAALQTAKAVSVRDAASIELASIGADGTIAGKSTTVSGNLTVSGDSTTFDLSSTNSADIASADSGVIPLKVRPHNAGTVGSIVVQNEAGTQVAGVSSPSTSNQLFHGGSSTNRVPLRIHGGVEPVVMGTGATSVGGSVDISSFGYTLPPVITLAVRQNNASTLKRRVAVNLENVATSSAFSFRVIQTSNEVLPDNETYYVHWIAMQALPGSAVG